MGIAFYRASRLVVKPFMPSVAFKICCPGDAVSRTANVERNGGHKWVKLEIETVSVTT